METDIRPDFDRSWPLPNRGFWRGNWPILVDGMAATINSSQPYTGDINRAMEKVIAAARRYPHLIRQ